MWWVLAATVVLGIAFLAGLQLWLAKHAISDMRALATMLAAVCIALALVAAAFAFWMFRLAAATKADRRWPPSSMRTSSDVRIRYLTSADALVTQMKAGAFALLLAAVALAAWGIWLLRGP